MAPGPPQHGDDADPMHDPRRDRCRALLQRLLNVEWPTRVGSVLQPFAQGVRRELRQEALVLQADCGLPPRPTRTVAQLTAVTAELLRTLGPARSEAAGRRQVHVRAMPQDLRVLADSRFVQLVDTARQLHARTSVHCVLHGSLATDDWTGYRDADLLLLLPDTVANDARALTRLRHQCIPLLRALWQFDPLQHHGVFALPMAELGAYPEHFLPLATLERAVDLGGNGLALDVCPILDTNAARAELRWVVDRLALYEPPRDAYGWKAFASVVMLLPALYLAAIGQPGWKGDSFALVEPQVPARLWQVQRWAAQLRQSWRDPTSSLLRRICRWLPNPRLGPLLARRLLPRSSPPWRSSPEQLRAEAHALAVHLHDKAVQQA